MCILPSILKDELSHAPSSSSARRQRPVESALPVHVLSRLHALVLPHTIVLVVARHLLVLGRLEPRKAHHLLHLPRVLVHVLWLLRVLLHLDVLWRLLLLNDGIAGTRRWLHRAATGCKVGSARACGC